MTTELTINFERQFFDASLNEQPTQFYASTQQFTDIDLALANKFTGIIRLAEQSLNDIERIYNSNEIFCTATVTITAGIKYNYRATGSTVQFNAVISSVKTQENILLYNK